MKKTGTDAIRPEQSRDAESLGSENLSEGLGKREEASGTGLVDVVVVGAVGIDTNVYFYTDEIDFEVEANFTQNLDYVGQAGGYTSRGFAQLGKQTAIIGYVGDDYHGELVRRELAGDGIDLTLFLDPLGTKRSVNFMYKDGRRKNFYDGKGSMETQPDLAVCKRVLEGARLAHFNIVNWSRYLLPVAKELGVTISCDIQDIVTADDDYRQDYIDYADILFFSAVNFPDPTPLIEQFLERKSERIIVTGMGAKGCALGTKDGVRFFRAIDLEMPVVDTNGAGDGLAVGFLTSYCLDGYSLEEAILRGQIVARYTCGIKASSANLIKREQLDAYFARLR